LAAHSGKNKHDEQHILGKKNLIDSRFWEKHDWQHILDELYIFFRMRCQSCFFPECAANQVFPRMCFQSGFFFQNVLLIMLIFPRMCYQPCFFSQNLLLIAHSEKKTWLTAQSGEKHDW
jgi:hypothetical protein